jgi:signal transduction histidine kinase
MAERLQGTPAPTPDARPRDATALVAASGAPGARPREALALGALDAMSAFVVVLAPDGTVAEANAAALAAGGLAREAVVGRPFREARWWSGSPAAVARLDEAVRAAAVGAPARCEAELLAAGEGTERALFELSVRPLRDGGQPPLLVVEGWDVTAARRARERVERDLADHAEDVERLAEELTRRKRELETALDAMRFAREQADRTSAQKTSLLRMVSHELRTPLAALLLQADRLRRDAAELSPHHRDAVGRMRSALTRLSGLVDSLLEFSRIDAGQVTITPERLDPVAMAAQVVEELRPTAAGKPIALSGPSLRPVPPLETDPRLLRVVLLNLVQNAIKFTDAGSVSVEIEVEGAEHRISVQDTGRGIAPEDQARIFEPFEQLEAVARKHTPGIGLGLALVRDMVGALGGRIALRSFPGVGSIFTVSLPSAGRPRARGDASGATPTPAPVG